MFDLELVLFELHVLPLLFVLCQMTLTVAQWFQVPDFDLRILSLLNARSHHKFIVRCNFNLSEISKHSKKFTDCTISTALSAHPFWSRSLVDDLRCVISGRAAICNCLSTFVLHRSSKNISRPSVYKK